MPMEWFRCPDRELITVKDCLASCRITQRCLTLPSLSLISTEREWNGIPSTTQLLNGTMLEFLKLTKPYIVDPDGRAFMLSGTKHHKALDDIAKSLGLPSEVALSIDRDIFDLLEVENGEFILEDYKLWGSFRVAKTLGLVEIGKQPNPNGEIYKTSGKWGKAGSPKMIPVFQAVASEVDNWETEYQLNRYTIKLEERGIPIKRMQVQITVRDGGLLSAKSRGVTRNTYMITIPRLDPATVKLYFDRKEKALLLALEQNDWAIPCDNRENWDGNRCTGYCDVSMYCAKGILYQQGG